MLKIFLLYPFIVLLFLAFFGKAHIKVAFGYTLALAFVDPVVALVYGWLAKDMYTALFFGQVFMFLDLILLFPIGVLMSYMITKPLPLKQTPAYATYVATNKGAKTAKAAYDTLPEEDQRKLRDMGIKVAGAAAKHGAAYLRSKGRTKTADFLDELRTLRS